MEKKEKTVRTNRVGLQTVEDVIKKVKLDQVLRNIFPARNNIMINVTDLEGNSKGKLEGHLKSDDFFGTEKFPEATFVITSVKGNEVKGDLTIKGHTEKESFALTTKGNTISGNVVIDRTKFGIQYKSGSFFDNLKDKAIDDEFELTLNIVF